MPSPILLDEPDALIVFDGACNLCSASVQMVIQMDLEGLVRFSSVQTSYGKALCQRHGVDPDAPSTFLFFDRGRALRASEGILALLARLPPPWRWLVVFRIIPQSWRDVAYRLVANNRYRLFGRRAACFIPTPQLKARFIEATPSGE